MNRKKKSMPKNPTDVTILRSILININNHVIVTAEDYDLEPDRFNAYISALVTQGIVSCITELPVDSSEDLIISDIILFNEWNKGYNKLYRFVEQIIIPIYQATLTAVLSSASK